MDRWKYHIETFGCKTNQYESQALREAWADLGGEECSDPAQARLICINSCAVTARGERDARNALFRLRRTAPAARIILTGCAARLLAEAAGGLADLIVTQKEKRRLLLGPWSGGENASQALLPDFSISGFTRTRAVLKVQDGCSQGCAYCIVPASRGAPRSRNPEEIIAEALRLAAGGCPEIVVSGINLRQYGQDHPDFGSFWTMLRRLDTALFASFGQATRLRVSSLDPAQLPEGLAVLPGLRLICPHLHLSLQHGSPQLLARMGRDHYDPREIGAYLARLGQIWGDFALGADLLAGFPGESAQDFGQLLDLAAALPLSYAHVFPYSPRPGTRAAEMPGQVPAGERRRRARILRQLAAQKRAQFLRRQLAQGPMRVIADHCVAGTASGLNQWYVRCHFSWSAVKAPAGQLAAWPSGLAANGLTVRLGPDPWAQGSNGV